MPVIKFKAKSAPKDKSKLKKLKSNAKTKMVVKRKGKLKK